MEKSFAVNQHKHIEATPLLLDQTEKFASNFVIYRFRFLPPVA
jgi:hypothetical protein